MNISLYIARRYLFAKKSHNAINIISLISACGVSIITMALICVLSVLNGFQSLIADMFTAFDPELKITALRGKTFTPTGTIFNAIDSVRGIDIISQTLEESVLVEYRDRQVTARIKGVSDNYDRQINAEKLIHSGEFRLRDESANYTTLGIGLAAQLGCYSSAIYPLSVYAPKRKARVNLANPTSSFNSDHLYVGGLFSINQPVYDENYMLVPIEVVRQLCDYPDEVSSLEIKLADDANPSQVKQTIASIPSFQENFRIEDRYEQQKEAFRMTQIEKWMIVLIFTFILLIAAFNIVGSLSMLMIDKRADAKILRNMGASKSFIRRIFLYEGWLISALGAATGLALGVALTLLQEHFGFIRLGNEEGAFITDAYPVKLLWEDLLLVLGIVGVIGFLSSYYSVRKFGNRWLNGQQNSLN